MKKCFAVLVLGVICFCCSSVVSAQEEPKKVWIDPQKYEIILLKPVGGEWASGFNEVILLNKETGQTWTLKSKSLKDGWVLMPRKDASD